MSAGSAVVQQQRPDLDSALAQGNQAVDILSGEVDSARCVGHITRLRDDLAPYRRTPGVREFIDRTQPLLAAQT